MWLQLRKRGVRVGRKRVERIMRVNGRQSAFLPQGLQARVDPAKPPSIRRRRICSAATFLSPPATRSRYPI
ncbi:IS3 family transposase [Candidatus Mycobacterium methanotrophicum]|uniref:IS3 family transposase n=1 Tax=Candidatus Mycobacterium methanotrophicum TaxID=2943498 RepID=UPI001C58542C